MASSDKIYLVGMPGSGKSTFGVELAKAMNTLFVDLDKEIEASEKKDISRIFTEKGEGYFRNVESKHLNKLSETEESFIMSTGGGTPCFHNGMNVMKERGVVVYLDVPIESLIKRLEKTDLSTRPKFEENSDINRQLADLYKERVSTYQMADIVIQVDEIDYSELARKIKEVMARKAD